MSPKQAQVANVVWDTLQHFINLNKNNPRDLHLIINALSRTGLWNVNNVQNIDVNSLDHVVGAMYKSGAYGHNKFTPQNQQYFIAINGQLPQLNAALQNSITSITNSHQQQNQARPKHRVNNTVPHVSNTPSHSNQWIPFETSPYSKTISVLDRLRPFMSNAEYKRLANDSDFRLGHIKYSPDMVNRATRVLEHLYDTGAGFSIQPDPQGHGRINAVLDDTKNRIRLFTNNDDTYMVGAVLTKHGSIYMRNASPTALIDFAVGNTTGRIVNQSSGPSNIIFKDPLNPGHTLEAHYGNLGGYYKTRNSKGRIVRKRRLTKSALKNAMTRNNRIALVRHIRNLGNNSASPEGSKDFLKLMIAHATLTYTEEALGADAKGTDDALSHDQRQVLAPYMNKHNITQDDRAKVAQVMNVLVKGDSFKHLGLNKKQRGLTQYAQRMAEQQEGVHVVDPEVVKDTYKILAHQGSKAQDQQLNNYIADKHLNDNDRIIAQENLGNSDAYNIKLTDSQRNLLDYMTTQSEKRIGTYEDGFDPNAVVNMERLLGNNIQNEMYLALNDVGYDPDHLKTYNMKYGHASDQTDPSLVTTKDHMLQFKAGKNNSNIAYTNSNTNHPAVLDYISNQLKKMGIHGNLRNPSDEHAPVPVAIDKQGVVRWQGYRQVTSYRNHHNITHWEPVQASIGQIFIPDKNHILHTNFNSHDNFNLIPSYKGWFQYAGMRLEKDPNTGRMRNVGKTALQRMRLSGFTQMFHERLNEDLSAQIMRMGDPRQRILNQNAFKNNDPRRLVVNDLTSPRDSSILNGLYHSELIGERVPDHWFQLMKNRHMSDEDIKAVLRTKLNKVSYGKRLAELNTDAIRDPNSDFALITDGRSMGNLTLLTRNLLDPDLTSGGKQQGLTRYLVDGVHLHLHKDGTYSVSPLTSKQIQHYAKLAHQKPSLFVGHAAIAYRPEFRFLLNMPWDRKSVAMKYATNERLRNMLKVRTAYITFGGDNMEDSTLISKATADKYKVPDRDLHNKLQYIDKNGNITHRNTGKLKMRPLKTGDKIDDFGHNKATVGLVIDPHMSMADAKAQHISKEVAIFKQNPDLQIVMSPHSPITRGNGAIADQAMSNHEKNVKPVTYTYTDKNGHKHTTKLGTSAPIDFQIVKATSDKQTVTYDPFNVQHGKVRKFSSQMGWGINAQHWIDPVGIDHKNAGRHIMYKIFGHNWRALSDLREYYLTTGIDLDRGGAPVNMDPKNISSHHPQEHRQLFMDQHTAKLKGVDPQKTKKYIVPNNSEDFLKALGSRGGTLVLPFNVHFYAIDPKKHKAFLATQYAYNTERTKALRKYKSYKNMPRTLSKKLFQDNRKAHNMYIQQHVTGNQVPILSAHLRNNMKLLSNGRTQINDYNSFYAYNNAGMGQNGIFTAALSYSRNKLMLDKFKKEPGVANAIKAQKAKDDNSPHSRIYKQATQYLNSLPRTDHGKRAANYLEKMRSAKNDAQENVNKIAQKTILRQLGGWENGNSMYNKHSFLREKIMARPMTHSSTAVSQNDMRLPIDTIAVSPHIYETLFGKDALKAAQKNAKNITGKDPDGLPKGMTYDPKQKNTRVLLTRDPVIYTGSERGFKVAVDTNPYMGQGFKMPAVNDNSFKGDNDGDTYSIINIGENKGVQNDLKHMSVPYQLIDHSGTKPVSFLDVGSDFIAGAQAAGIAQPQYITQGPNRNVEALKQKGLLNKDGDPQALKDAMRHNPYNTVSQEDAKKGVFGLSVKQQVENKLLDIATEISVKTPSGTKTLSKKQNPKDYDKAIAHDKPIVQKVIDYKKSPNHNYKQCKAYAKKNEAKLHIDMDATMHNRNKDSNHFKNVCIRNDFGASNLDFTNDKALFNSMNNTVLIQGAKGNPSAERNFNDYRLGVANNVDLLASAQTLKDLQSGKSKNVHTSLAPLATSTQMKIRLQHLNKHLTAIHNSPKAVQYYQKQSHITLDPDKDSEDLAKDKSAKMNAKLLLKAFKMADNSKSDDYVGAFNVQSMSYQDICMQNALESKSFNTASAGTKPQQLVSAFGDKHPNLALRVTYEETQANLQGKHHPELIPQIKEMLDVRVPNLLNGLQANTPSPNSVYDSQRKAYRASVSAAKQLHEPVPKYMHENYGHVSVKDFTKQYYDTFKEAGTDVSPKEVKKLGNVLSENTGTIKSVKDVKAKNGGSLLTGAYDGDNNNPGGFKYARNTSQHNSSPEVRQKHNEHSLIGKGYAQQWFPRNMVAINNKRGNKDLSRNTPDKMIDPSNMTARGRLLLDSERKLDPKKLNAFKDRNLTTLHDRTKEQHAIDKLRKEKSKNFVQSIDKNLQKQKEGSKVMANKPQQSSVDDGDINYSDTGSSADTELQNNSTKSMASSIDSRKPSSSKASSASSKIAPKSRSTSVKAQAHPVKSQSSWRDYELSSIRADKYERHEVDKAVSSGSDGVTNTTPSSEKSVETSNSDSTLTSAQILARRRSYNASHQSESGSEF